MTFYPSKRTALVHIPNSAKNSWSISTSLRRFAFLRALAAIACLALPGALHAQSAPASPAKLATSSPFSAPGIEERVEKLLKQMTLEEKIGQLVQYSAGQPTGPGSGRTGDDDMIRKGEIGSLFNVTGAAQVNAFQKIAVEQSRLHIPLIFGLDVIHGFRTTFPIPLGMSATWDPSLVERASRVAAKEAAASGVRWTFSPMVDIARDARWGRMAEGGGEDPYLGSLLAAAYVRGYQGKDLSALDTVASCPKHYVGYGAAEGGRDYNSTEISEHTLRQFYLPPFHAGVNAGAATIMSAFNSLNGVPTSANYFTLTQILRKEWDFRGFVVSDWESVRELMAHGLGNDGATAARRAFNAGVDMDMVSNLYHANMLDLVKSGRVSQAQIDDSVRRILRVKFALGLFDHPYADEAKDAGAQLLPDSVNLSREVAAHSFVLLKNDAVNGSPLLPLSAGSGSVALIGPLADDAGNMLGSWGGLGRAEDVVTLRTALVKKLGADHVHYARGSEILEGTDADLSAAVEAAKQSDVVILALGENAPEMTGEAASRAHLELPGTQQQKLLEQVVATGKPVVLLLFSGRPLTLPWAFEHVPATLAAWFPGVQAGPALVDVLFGSQYPTGRLTVSWPRAVGQEPLYYNALNTGRPVAANIDLTHPPRDGERFFTRYIDEQNSPQFPFGYGLTYTTFSYGPVQISATQIDAAKLNAALRDKKMQSVLTATAEVTNSGKTAAEETIQLYIGVRGASIALPVRALRGFQKIKLAPGETRKVTFEITPEDLAFWNQQNVFIVEPSRATIWISPNSATGQGVAVELTGQPI